MKHIFTIFSILFLLGSSSILGAVAQTSPYGGVLNFQHTDTSITPFDSYLGDWLLVDAMATWCGPCKEQLREMNQIHDNVKDVITFLSLSVDYIDDNLSLVQSYEDEQQVAWTFGWDYDGQFQQEYLVDAFPTLMLFDPDGQLRKTWTGLQPAETLLEELEGNTDGDLRLSIFAGATIEGFAPFFILATVFMVIYVIYFFYQRNRA